MVHSVFSPMRMSWVLRKVINAREEQLPRTEIIKRLWRYIKDNGLQDKVNRRNINCDEALQVLFNKKSVSMFEMTKLVSKHLSFPKNFVKRQRLVRKLQRTEEEAAKITRQIELLDRNP